MHSLLVYLTKFAVMLPASDNDISEDHSPKIISTLLIYCSLDFKATLRRSALFNFCTGLEMQ